MWKLNATVLCSKENVGSLRMRSTKKGIIIKQLKYCKLCLVSSFISVLSRLKSTNYIKTKNILGIHSAALGKI